MRKLSFLIIVLTLSLTPSLVLLAQDSENNPKAIPISPDGVQRLDIVVDSYSYSPAHIEVKASSPVELTLRSVTSVVPHNFVIDDPASGIELEQSVPSGKDVTLTFTPVNTGTYKFYCSKSGIFGSHLDKGMEGTITVVE